MTDDQADRLIAVLEDISDLLHKMTVEDGDNTGLALKVKVDVPGSVEVCGDITSHEPRGE